MRSNVNKDDKFFLFNYFTPCNKMEFVFHSICLNYKRLFVFMHCFFELNNKLGLLNILKNKQ